MNPAMNKLATKYHTDMLITSVDSSRIRHAKLLTRRDVEIMAFLLRYLSAIAPKTG